MKQNILFFSIVLLVGCFGSEPQKTGLEGKPLPEFNILLLDSLTSLNSRNIHSNNAIVLFCLSPHCPYCKAQTKEIIEDMSKLKEIQFYFITSYSLTEMKSFYNEYELAKYPNIITGVDTANFLNDYFEIPGVPYLAIYGKDKILRKTFMGKIYSSQIKNVASE